MGQKFIMESKDEVSDIDSGIILQFGFDSLVFLMKELVYVVYKQQRVLEVRLEVCLEELRRFCLWEVELMGILLVEYFFKLGEKVFKVCCRIGVVYKLDDWVLYREDFLSSLECQLVLQLQIIEVVCWLCLEENFGRQVWWQWKYFMLQEEKKLQEFQCCLVEWRCNSELFLVVVFFLG